MMRIVDDVFQVVRAQRVLTVYLSEHGSKVPCFYAPNAPGA